MKTLNEHDFAMLCFLVLMGNGEGIIDKAPSYIFENLHMLQDGYEAVGRLNLHNMRIVIKWHERWNVEVPRQVMDLYQRCEEAATELRSRGVDL